MDFFSIEEIVNLLNQSRRTVDRKIAAIEKKHPDKFRGWIKKDGVRVLYNSEIVRKLGVHVPTEADIAFTPSVITISPDTKDHDERWILFNEVVFNYSAGDKTLKQCVKDAGCDMVTFQQWVMNDDKMLKKLEQARELFKRNAFAEVADLTTLQLKFAATGYDKVLSSINYELKTGPNGEIIEIPVFKKTSHKHVTPNAMLMALALTNLDPENWKRNPMKDFEKLDRSDPLDNLSEAEMKEYLRKADELGIAPSDGFGSNSEMI